MGSFSCSDDRDVSFASHPRLCIIAIKRARPQGRDSCEPSQGKGAFSRFSGATCRIMQTSIRDATRRHDMDERSKTFPFPKRIASYAFLPTRDARSKRACFLFLPKTGRRDGCPLGSIPSERPGTNETKRRRAFGRARTRDACCSKPSMGRVKNTRGTFFTWKDARTCSCASLSLLRAVLVRLVQAWVRRSFALGRGSCEGRDRVESMG